VGTSGCTVVWRLAHSKRHPSVLLVEAGGNNDSKAVRVDGDRYAESSRHIKNSLLTLGDPTDGSMFSIRSRIGDTKWCRKSTLAELLSLFACRPRAQERQRRGYPAVLEAEPILMQYIPHGRDM
jgi:choline dehydrogenase-like flavoprotein